MKKSALVQPALMVFVCAVIVTLALTAWQADAQAGNTGAGAGQQTGAGAGRGAGGAGGGRGAAAGGGGQAGAAAAGGGAGRGAGGGAGGGGGPVANAGSPWPEMYLGGDGSAVLALQRSIEAAVVKGDTAYVDSVTTPDFTFWHGSAWVTNSKGTTYDDKAAFLKRVTEKQYLVHDLATDVKVELHGNLAISFGRYISLFVPDRTAAGPPARLSSIWFERVFEKQNGKWMWVSHKTVYGPITSPAGVDATQLDPNHQGSYIPGMPFVHKAPQDFPPPSSPDGVEVLALDKKLNECVPAGDWQFFDSVTSDDFQMWHGDGWTRGGAPNLIDDKPTFENRVKTKQYIALDGDSTQVEMHGDIAITYGRYLATLRGSAERNPQTAWFSVWFERVYQKRDGKWMYVSYKTVHGATYAPSKEAFLVN